MPELIPLPDVQIFNDGSCVRIQSGEKTLLVAKEQVKTIDTVHQNMVRIDIGEGPLKNIFLNYQQVAQPIVASADELRDAIAAMLISEAVEGTSATELTQMNIFNQLTMIVSLLQDIHLIQSDLTKKTPSRIDQSNPNLVYEGWHSMRGAPDQAEWAIRRIRKEGDQVYYEWAGGIQSAVFRWTMRDQHRYFHMFFLAAHAVVEQEPVEGDSNQIAE
jgi:hypothetical protein